LFFCWKEKQNKTKTNNSEETSKIKGNFRNINKSRETLQGRQAQPLEQKTKK
jgi:hypothetical protein